MKASKLAELFIKEKYQLCILVEDIILNRDSKFTGEFYCLILQILKMNKKIFIVFYTKTDS